MKLSLLLPLGCLALFGCASNNQASNTSSAGYYSTVYDPAFYTNPWQDDIFVNIPGIRPTPPVATPATLPARLPGAHAVR